MPYHEERWRRRCRYRKRNVHDSTGQEHVGSRINAFKLSTRRIQFLDGRIVVGIQGAEETTIVFQVPIDGSREMVGVNLIAIGFVVLFVAWIVD